LVVPPPPAAGGGGGGGRARRHMRDHTLTRTNSELIDPKDQYRASPAHLSGSGTVLLSWR
jgi:hypothetical protein